LLSILDFGQHGPLKLKKTLPHANGFKVTGKLHRTVKVKALKIICFFSQIRNFAMDFKISMLCHRNNAGNSTFV